MIRIEVFTRSNCPLCDELAEHLLSLADELPLDVTWVDIASDEGLEAEHGHRIPVVRIEGRERFFGRVDPVLLRRTLRAQARRGSWWSRLTEKLSRRSGGSERA
ncbi:MAG: glutaredoxin family protein [Planctomycetota bacterium]